MLTLIECRDNDGYLRVPRIGRGDVRLLWHDGYWDGPMSGLLVFQGEECWFEMVAESETETWYRRFAIVRLSPEQLAEERRWHELFQRFVGTHTDYSESGRGEAGTVHPREWHRGFYDQYEHRTPRDFSHNPVLAWFEGF